MGTKQITIWIEPEIREAIRPVLKRDGLSLSSFVRKAMHDYVDAYNSRRTVIQIDDIEVLR